MVWLLITLWIQLCEVSIFTSSYWWYDFCDYIMNTATWDFLFTSSYWWNNFCDYIMNTATGDFLFTSIVTDGMTSVITLWIQLCKVLFYYAFSQVVYWWPDFNDYIIKTAPRGFLFLCFSHAFFFLCVVNELFCVERYPQVSHL